MEIKRLPPGYQESLLQTKMYSVFQKHLIENEQILLCTLHIVIIIINFLYYTAYTLVYCVPFHTFKILPTVTLLNTVFATSLWQCVSENDLGIGKLECCEAWI